MSSGRSSTMPEDEQGLTKPEIFSYPASPHLASRIDNHTIDFDKIKHATEVLSEHTHTEM